MFLRLVTLAWLTQLMVVSLGQNSKEPCIFEYNSSLISQGEIYSPNYPQAYPNNLNCRYEFYARENERVIIQVDDFQLEPPQNTNVQDVNFMDFIETITRPMRLSDDTYKIRSSTTTTTANANPNDDPNRQCFYDFLDLFTSDGQGRLFWRSRHCGSHIDSQLVSTSPTLILVFKTDRMLGYRGFKFRFHFSYLNILPFVTDPACGPSEIMGNGSVLASPNYPLMFPSNVECAWTITVEKSRNILIKFIDVNLDQACHLSYLSIWDGYVSDVNKPDFTICERLSYIRKGILQFKSVTNRLVIKFVGDKKIEKPGVVSSGGGYRNTIQSLSGAANRTKAVDANSKIKNGFFISWTAIRLADECDDEFRCEGGEFCIDTKNFICQQTYRYCISKNLVCDGVLNCDTGDESDEKHCELSFLKSQLYVTMFIISSIVFVVLTMLCVIIYKLFRKHSKNGSKFDHMTNDFKQKFNNHEEFKFKPMPMPTMIHVEKPSLVPMSEKFTSDQEEEDTDDLSTSYKINFKCSGNNNTRMLNINPNRGRAGLNDDSYCEEENETENDDSKLATSSNSNEQQYNSDSPEESNLLFKKKNLVKTYSNHHSTYPKYMIQNNNNTNRNSNNNNNNYSTPTYSSSLPSEGSLVSPADNNLNNMMYEKTINIDEQSPSMNIYSLTSTMQKNRQNYRLRKYEDSTNSLRRNSYTKAIFYENEQE